MAEQNEEADRKRKSNRRSGILFVILGIVGISTRFIFGGEEWRTVDYVKIIFSIAAIGYGLFLIYRSRASNNTMN